MNDFLRVILTITLSTYVAKRAMEIGNPQYYSMLYKDLSTGQHTVEQISDLDEGIALASDEIKLMLSVMLTHIFAITSIFTKGIPFKVLGFIVLIIGHNQMNMVTIGKNIEPGQIRKKAIIAVSVIMLYLIGCIVYPLIFVNS